MHPTASTSPNAPVIVRPAGERGLADHGWLRSFHTFSFADFYDPAHMGFRALRVINEDRVSPGQGFGSHPHRDMEILSYVLAGALAHADSTGQRGVVRPGELQRMSAGTGVAHSETNASDREPVHFLQIWILPERRGLAPSYQQVAFPAEERRGALRLIASRDGRDGSVTIQQDVNLYSALLEPGQKVAFDLPAGRGAWIQMARGSVSAGGKILEAGDGARTEQSGRIELAALAPAEVLLFDLA
jgi:hypothetical protein